MAKMCFTVFQYMIILLILLYILLMILRVNEKNSMLIQKMGWWINGYKIPISKMYPNHFKQHEARLSICKTGCYFVPFVLERILTMTLQPHYFPG